MNDGESGNGPVVDPAPPRRGLSFHAPRVGLGVVLALLTYGLFRTAPAVDLPIYEVGSVAVDNVIAPFAFRVLKTKDELEKERTAIANAVEPVFAYVPSAVDSAKNSLNSFGAAIGQAATATPQTAVAARSSFSPGWKTMSCASSTFLARMKLVSSPPSGEPR